MTEAEAKTKICPQTFGVRELYNGPWRCIASECMAWRWIETDAFKAMANAEYVKSGKRLSPTDGYCGLAGRL